MVYEIPEMYDDVERKLIPLFETPGSWFRGHIIDPDYIYETVCGPFAGIATLTPEAVSFLTVDRYIDPVEYNSKIDHANGIVPVVDENAAESQSERAGWVSSGYPRQIGERVPFESRVTTFEELRSELTDIFSNEAAWDQLDQRLTNFVKGTEFETDA